MVDADNAHDDWDSHWEQYGSAALGNPANDFRASLIFSRIPTDGRERRILDIGSGQGDLVLRLCGLYPNSDVRGLEYSAAGVARSRSAAAALGSPATFWERDLLHAETVPSSEAGWATTAICSEVLEHVDCPELLLKNAAAYLAPNCRLIVTVPGGPRTAFDKHIGHRQHFSGDSLRRLLTATGFIEINISRAGFPFFNLYKLTVFLSSKAMISRLASGGWSPSRLTKVTTCLFRFSFRWTVRDNRLGWQLVATARIPDHC